MGSTFTVTVPMTREPLRVSPIRNQMNATFGIAPSVAPLNREVGSQWNSLKVELENESQVKELLGGSGSDCKGFVNKGPDEYEKAPSESLNQSGGYNDNNGDGYGDSNSVQSQSDSRLQSRLPLYSQSYSQSRPHPHPHSLQHSYSVYSSGQASSRDCGEARLPVIDSEDASSRLLRHAGSFSVKRMNTVKQSRAVILKGIESLYVLGMDGLAPIVSAATSNGDMLLSELGSVAGASQKPSVSGGSVALRSRVASSSLPPSSKSSNKSKHLNSRKAIRGRSTPPAFEDIVNEGDEKEESVVIREIDRDDDAEEEEMEVKMVVSSVELPALVVNNMGKKQSDTAAVADVKSEVDDVPYSRSRRASGVPSLPFAVPTNKGTSDRGNISSIKALNPGNSHSVPILHDASILIDPRNDIVSSDDTNIPAARISLKSSFKRTSRKEKSNSNTNSTHNVNINSTGGGNGGIIINNYLPFAPLPLSLTPVHVIEDEKMNREDVLKIESHETTGTNVTQTKGKVLNDKNKVVYNLLVVDDSPLNRKMLSQQYPSFLTNK